jgi:hypothetical protein
MRGSVAEHSNSVPIIDPMSNLFIAPVCAPPFLPISLSPHGEEIFLFTVFIL